MMITVNWLTANKQFISSKWSYSVVLFSLSVIPGGGAPSAQMSQRDNRLFPQPKPNFFVLDERAGLVQN